MSKFIRTILIGIAPLALLALGAQVHAQATDVDCSGCVDTKDIAFQAVTTGKIDQQAVTTGKIRFRAVTKSKIASNAVTTPKIKDGAVTVAKVAPELSNAIGMFCPPDETVVGMETDGTFSCEVPQTLATEANGNTRAGTGALSVNTTGASNTAVGAFTLNQNTTGFNNTAVGAFTLNQNTTGPFNSAVGSQALQNNTTSNSNTAFGYQSLTNNTTGNSNTAVGSVALQNNTTGHSNVAIGVEAGRFHTTGNSNIAIGHRGVAAESNTIRIGFLQTRTFIDGIRGRVTGVDDAINVVIDSNGQLGTINSSRRYKEQIHDMAAASERLLSLRPVTFRYKKAFAGGNKPMQFGLIAEEVAEVFPELVVYNEDGTPDAVKYRLLSTLLLNELQKQGAELRGQRIELQALAARLERLEIAKAGAVASIQ